MMLKGQVSNNKSNIFPIFKKQRHDYKLYYAKYNSGADRFFTQLT